MEKITLLLKKQIPADNIEELNEKERYWIKYYNSNYKVFGYNLDSGGVMAEKNLKRPKEK